MGELLVRMYPDCGDAAAAARLTDPRIADHLEHGRRINQGAFNFVAFDDEVAVGSLKLIQRHVMDERARIADVDVATQLRRRGDERDEVMDRLIGHAEAISRMTSVSIFSYLHDQQPYHGILVARGYNEAEINRIAAMEKRFDK